MKVWVLRHGEAQNQAASDEARELTPAGRTQVLHSTALLVGVPLDGILASPYVRAQQTASLVHGALGRTEPVLTVPWLTPDSSPLHTAGELERLGWENILLVSHQPLVSALLSVLETGQAINEHPMGTASLAELEGDWPLPGLMSLRSLRHC
jgi:phosphohistidine phosphatase